MSAQLEEADAEERAMEAEALEAIFMESYSMDGATYRLELEPERTRRTSPVHSSIMPGRLPSSSPPSFSIATRRSHAKELQTV